MFSGPLSEIWRAQFIVRQMLECVLIFLSVPQSSPFTLVLCYFSSVAIFLMLSVQRSIPYSMNGFCLTLSLCVFLSLCKNSNWHDIRTYITHLEMVIILFTNNICFFQTRSFLINLALSFDLHCAWDHLVLPRTSVTIRPGLLSTFLSIISSTPTERTRPLEILVSVGASIDLIFFRLTEVLDDLIFSAIPFSWCY